MKLRRNMHAEVAPTAAMPAMAEQEFDILLQPLSHPELGEIRINESLFAIGRTEQPFESYAPEVVADLSRRHARIFCEYGAVYIADLGSKNGTSVNGVDVRQRTTRLQDGDEIRFGGVLSYRVRLGKRPQVQAPSRVAKLESLTLAPERDDLGLQPIVITQFPFLISKADTTFSRYKSDYPHQVNYLSRRHAHIFLKGGKPYVEDLGSTNGTFVSGKRLDEHAVALNEGDALAFGGHHFVYKVSLQQQESELEPTITKLSPAARRALENPAEVEKTTFVESADSFLDIFCVDRAQQQEDEVNEQAQQPAEAGNEAGKRPARSKSAVFIAELMEAFGGSDWRRDPDQRRRARRWGMALAALLTVFALLLYFRAAPEEELKDLLASGKYAQAVTVADDNLKRDPDNGQLKALGTEALLKASVPGWLKLLKARDFAGARRVLDGMKKTGSHNADAQPLLNELEWMGNIEEFVMGRGGVEAPIRLYADEDRIRALLKRWDEDMQGHQTAFAAISSHVPEFRDPYAVALSHLRKLQSDDAVYLAAIERLKAAVASELSRDNPQALDDVLKEYAEKYPRIGGLDNLRQDLRRYTQIQEEARAGNLGRLLALTANARFSTPPFQVKFRALQSGNQLPPADVVAQYQAALQAWRAGDVKQAYAALQKMTAGPWAEAVAKQLERKKAIEDQFAQLLKTRGAAGYDDRLLAFYASLDPDEDVYFMKAVGTDIAALKDKALRRAQELFLSAQAKWRRYRDNGAIEGTQRLEGTISDKFRTQAQLLAQASEEAQQGMRFYTQLKMEQPAGWRKVQDEISAEAQQQRKSLQEARDVLSPALWKAKLALLGGQEQ